MNNNIDQLRTEVDEIKNSLNSLKNDVNLSESEKKTQADLLKAQAETTKGKIQQEISALESQTDATAQQKLEEARALLQSFNDITSLYESIISGLTNPPAAPQPGNENKNVFVKAKDWVGNQWYDIWDKSKWKSETGSNLLRTAGFVATGVGAGALIYTGFKKLFGKEAREERRRKKEEKRKQKEKERAEKAAAKQAEEEDDEEEETTSKKKKKKKKPFWDRWYGKAIKWGAITVGGITLANWLGKKFGWRGVDEDNPTDKESSEVKYKAFEKLDQESKETYNELGNQIDNTYKKIFDKELQAGYQDEIDMGRTAREVQGNLDNTGIIPFCLDNKFGSVEELMGQNHSISEAMRGGVQKMVGWLKSVGNNMLETFASDYLSKLPSWTGMTFVATTLEGKVEERAKKNGNTQRELEYFFRQSIRVERYFFEKRRQLEYALAERAANALGNGKKAEDILKDDSLYEEWIENEPTYQSFLHSSLLASSNILKTEGMLDDNISSDTQETVEELDQKRDEILGKNASDSKDVIQIINEKVDNNESISSAEKTLLSNACTNMCKDIEDSIIPALEDSPLAIWENLLGTSDDPNIKKYIQKGGIIGMISDFRSVLGGGKQKLDNGELSPAEIKELAGKINNLLALKKEIILGAGTIGMEDDNILFKGIQFVYGSVCNLYKGVEKICDLDILEGLEYIASGIPGTLMGVGAVEIVLGGGMVLTGNFGKGFKLMWKGAKTAGAPVYGVYLLGKCAVNGVRKSGIGRCSSSATRNLLSKSKRLQRLQFRGTEGAKNFKAAFHRGELSISEAADILALKVDSRDNTIARQWLDEFKLDKNATIVSLENDGLYVKKCLFDDYFLSKKGDNATSRALLDKIKAKPELYERAINWFDRDVSVKEFIQSGGNNIDTLEAKLGDLEQAAEDLARRRRFTPDRFSQENERIWSEHTLKNEFDGERTALENDRARKLDEIRSQEEKLNRPNTTERQKQTCRDRINRARTELNKTEGKLGKLDNFERELKITMSDMADETAIKNLLGEYEQIIKQLKLHGSNATSSMSEVIDQVKCVIKLGELERPNGGGKYFKDLEDILKNIIPTSTMANDPRSIAHILSEHPELNVDASKFKRLANNITDMRAARGASWVNDGLEYSAKVLQKLVKVVRRMPR